jgi:hypothetical protein
MAKIIEFDPSRKVPPKHYTPEAMRGRLLQFKSRAASAETGAATTVNGTSQLDTSADRNTSDTKIS